VTAFSELFCDGIEIFIQMKGWALDYVIYNGISAVMQTVNGANLTHDLSHIGSNGLAILTISSLGSAYLRR